MIGHEEVNNYPLDGVDLDPVLFNNESLETRDLYWIWNTRTNRWALRYGDWKIVKYQIDEPQQAADWQLFNLVQDPQETTNVAADHPEILAQLHDLFVIQRGKDQK